MTGSFEIGPLSTMRQAGPLLAAILIHLARHPYAGEDLTYDDITFQQHYTEADGTRVVSVLGEPPEVMAASVELLEQADPKFLRFERGLLIIDVQPERLLYEPLYLGRRAELVVFRRVCSRCYGGRKVPDWTNWNAEYGEPRPKPCPECAVRTVET